MKFININKGTHSYRSLLLRDQSIVEMYVAVWNNAFNHLSVQWLIEFQNFCLKKFDLLESKPRTLDRKSVV